MSLIARLRGLLRGDRLGHDLDDELRSHVEMRTADNIAAGMSPEDARYEAQKRFGNSTLLKEDTRKVDIVAWLDATYQNLRFACRMLGRSPGFTLVAILTLALGIGGNVAIFTVVRAVLLCPLPYSNPEQLVRVYDDLRGSTAHDVGMSVPELWDLRDKSGIFQDISALWSIDANLTGSEQPQRVELLATGPEYFTMLGARPQLGRLYTAQDSQPGFSEGIVLSDSFWRRTFGADPQVLGKQIRVDSDLYTILGVMPPDFKHPGRTITNEVDIWGAAGFAGAPFPTPPPRGLRMLPGAMGRLKPGITLAQAQDRLRAFSAQLTSQFPVEYPAAAEWHLRLVAVQEDLVGNVRTELFVLLGAVAFVLLIACVNLANLLLARSASRQREIAIRLAVGAGRARLITQLLTESILLATISGVVAMVAVVWTKTWLLKLAPPDLPRLNEIGVSSGVLLFAFAVSIITGIAFGLAPALQMARSSHLSNLREGSRGSGCSKQQMNLSRALVTSEIALSLILLIGTGLLLRSFLHLSGVPPGFDPHRVTTTKIWLARPNNPDLDPYRTAEKRGAFYQEVLRRVGSLPGVEQAAIGSLNSLPMNVVRFQNAFVIENRTADSERAPQADFMSVTPDYFQLLRAPLIRGRGFTDADVPTTQFVAVVNETLARRYWPGQDPIGQHIRGTQRAQNQAQNPWITIVGVVGDIKSNGLDTASSPIVYRPLFQNPGYGAVVLVRTGNAPGTLGDAIRHEVQTVDPNIPVFGLRTLDEILAASLAQRRFAVHLLGVFAAGALLLASIGIYGVMAYTFSRRTNEFGIRIAMGAQRRDIFRIAVGEGATLVVIGIISGALASVLLTRFLQSMLFEIKPTDPATYFGISVLLAAVTLLACLVPARRATRVDPLTALRQD